MHDPRPSRQLSAVAALGLLLSGDQLLACKGGKDGPVGGDSGGASPEAAPWDDLDPVALEPLRPFLSTELTRAQSPTRLTALRSIPLTVAVDDADGRGWVLDGRYRHDPSSHCLTLDEWPELDPDGAYQGDCQDGQAQVQRGVFSPEGHLLAATADATHQAFWVLLDSGLLARAAADPTAHAFEMLRPAPVTTLADTDTGPFLMAADGEGGVVLADAERLRWLDHEGVEQASVEVAGSDTQGSDVQVLDLLVQEGQAWCLTDTALLRWQGADLETVRAVAGTGGRLADGWASLPAEGQLVELSTEQSVAVEGLTGPLSRWGDRTWAAVQGGLVRIEAGAEVARFSTEPVVDLVVQATSELAVLHEGGRVAVYGDETALQGAAPLQLTLVSYLENPKNGADDEDVCSGGTRKLDEVIALATQARGLLDDLPAPVALGIIPAVAQASILCEREADLRAIWEGERIATGLFFREEADTELSDALDLEAHLQGQAEAHLAQGIPIRWTRGADHYGGDWPMALQATALSDEVLAPDLGIWDEIEAEDIRSKDPLPWHADQPRTAWHPGSSGDDGDTIVRPGNSISLFDIAGCPNTWIRECKELTLGGANTVQEDDIEVISLDLFRALAVRSADGPDHWSFHLPALGAFEYQDGCTVEDRIWQGEACEARLIQQFLLDVHGRYVSAGLAAWWLPD